MRNFLSLILGLAVLGVPSANADDLCRRDEKKVLSAIDQICGDTWCEGDYNFQFRKIRCNFKLGSCILKFRTAPWKSNDEQDYEWGADQACVIREVDSLDQLVRTVGTAAELQDPVYEQITSCIDHLSPRHQQ